MLLLVLVLELVLLLLLAVLLVVLLVVVLLLVVVVVLLLLLPVQLALCVAQYAWFCPAVVAVAGRFWPAVLCGHGVTVNCSLAWDVSVATFYLQLLGW